MADSTLTTIPVAGPTVALHPFVIHAGADTEISTRYALWLVFDGAQEDYTVVAGKTPLAWTVTTQTGVTYEIEGVRRLKFDDAVVTKGVVVVTELENVPYQRFDTEGLPLALARGLLGDAANPAAVGEAAAYIEAFGLSTTLALMESSGTLAALAGSTNPDILMRFVYENLTGKAADDKTLAELGQQVHAKLETAALTLPEWTAQTPAAVVHATLLSSKLQFELVEDPAFKLLSYPAFDGPLIGTDASDTVNTGWMGGSFNLGGGIDTASFGTPFADLMLTRPSKGVLNIEDADGNKWTLENVERLFFFGEARAFDLTADGAAGQAARFIAVTAGASEIDNPVLVAKVLRQIDDKGLEAFVDADVQSGAIADLAGGITFEVLVELLYRNIAGSEPSRAERDWTVDWIDSQRWDAADVVQFVLDLPQTAALIGLPELADQGLIYDSWTYGV